VLVVQEEKGGVLEVGGQGMFEVGRGRYTEREKKREC
jgi:hypothetical protein